MSHRDHISLFTCTVSEILLSYLSTLLNDHFLIVSVLCVVCSAGNHYQELLLHLLPDSLWCRCTLPNWLDLSVFYSWRSVANSPLATEKLWRHVTK